MQALFSFLVLRDASRASGANSKEEEASLRSLKHQTYHALYKHLRAHMRQNENMAYENVFMKLVSLSKRFNPR